MPTNKLPKIDLQPLSMEDLEFLPIGTPVVSSDSALIQFLETVSFDGKRQRTEGGDKSEQWITNVEFRSGFGRPKGEQRCLSSVTNYHIKRDKYKVIVSPKLDELRQFYVEGYEYWESLPTPEDGVRDRLLVHDRDNPYPRRSPMGMAWYEGFLDARQGRPNPFRKE